MRARFLFLLIALALVTSGCLTRRGGGGGGGSDDDDSGPVEDDDDVVNDDDVVDDDDVADDDDDVVDDDDAVDDDDDVVVDDDDATGCGTDEVEDCVGGCTLASWIGDEYCDESLNCAAFAFDGGDCDTGDDDDTVADDDDVVVDDDDTAGGTGPYVLPIDTDHMDIFEVWGVSSGSTVQITIDTISTSTTFDPAIVVMGDPDPNNAFDSFDDEIPCTYPPPSYDCPQGSVTVPSTGLYFAVGAASSGFGGATAEYSVEILEGGSPTNDFSLYEDDWLVP